MTPKDRLRIQTLVTRLFQGQGALQKALSKTEGPSRLETAYQVLQDYERLAREVYRLRARRRSGEELDPLVSRAEGMMATVTTDLVQSTRSRDHRSAYSIFINEYRRIWRENSSLFVFTAAAFGGSLLLGWNIGRFQEAYVPLIVGQQMMEQIIDHRPWFERLAKDPIGGSIQIAINNVVVCLRTFAFGAIGGLGGFALLLFNGVMIGTLMGYCAAHDFEHRLGEFVVSHGFLELSVIVSSAFASFLIGRAFFIRPLSNFLSHLSVGAKEGFIVAAGVTPWLILAAFFEAFVSPMPFFDLRTKVIAGLVLGVLFWSWTYWPVGRDSLRRAP